MEEACIGAVIANNNREVGVALFSLSHPMLILKQVADDRMFSEVLQSIEGVKTILFPDSHTHHRLYDMLSQKKFNVVLYRRQKFSEDRGMDLLTKLSVLQLDPREAERRHLARSAASALIGYLETTENCSFAKNSLQISFGDCIEGRLVMDQVTIRNLELISNRRSTLGKRIKNGCVFDIINLTLTKPGYRLLRSQLISPLSDLDAIHRRQNLVENLLARDDRLKTLQEFLPRFHDVDQLTSHYAVIPKKSSLRTLKREADNAIRLREVLQVGGELFASDATKFSTDVQTSLGELLQFINTKIHEEAVFRKGAEEQRVESIHCIKSGLDDVLDLARESHSNCIETMKEYADSLDIENIQLGFSTPRGYFLKVPLTAVNDSSIFLQCVKLKRYAACTTAELVSLNIRQEDALREALIRTEYHLAQLRDQVRKALPSLIALTEAVAELDLLQSLARFSETLAKPTVIAASDVSRLQVIGGRHIILEKALAENDSEEFVPNDIDLKSLSLVVGPNCAGKTTYLKQCALIVILAQLGARVPADSATIPIYTHISTRIGNEDNLEGNASTFSLEMTEISNLLRSLKPGKHQLVLVDELCRGTSTEEGMSLAFAIAEVLGRSPNVDTLFATHFHQLQHAFPGVLSFTITSDTVGKTLLFQHRIKQGAQADDLPYGIELARSCGFPKALIECAFETRDYLLNQIQSKKASLQRFRILSESVTTLNLDQVRRCLMEISGQ